MPAMATEAHCLLSKDFRVSDKMVMGSYPPAKGMQQGTSSGAGREGIAITPKRPECSENGPLRPPRRVRASP